MFHSTAVRRNICKKQIRWIMSVIEKNVRILLEKTLMGNFKIILTFLLVQESI